MDQSPPGSSVHGILQARILEWVAMPFSRGSSQPRDWILVFCIAESLPSEPQRKPNKGLRFFQDKSLKRWLWPTPQALVPSLRRSQLFSSHPPSHDLTIPSIHEFCAQNCPVFFFTVYPQALPLLPADTETRRPLASGVAGDPGVVSFKLDDLSTQDLRGCSTTKIKFIWLWKFGLDWHDREERRFVCVCVCVFSEWKSRDKTSEAKVSKCFQPTCSFRIAAGQGKAKGKAKLKKVLFCPTGQKSYECFEVRVVTWSKCFRKIN